MPPTDPLRPVIPSNACTLRLTAAAGTELAGASLPAFVKLDAINVQPFLTGERGLQP